MAAGQGRRPVGGLLPRRVLGDLPLFYPFIVNDPGEGAQAKRRAHAVIIDHLTPPMTTADAYGELAELPQLVDEYYQVELLDPSKMPLLQQQIWDLIQQAHLEEDLKYLMRQDHGDHTHEWDEGTTPEGTPLTLAKMQGREFAHLIEDLDGYLCELAGAQIRDGLHILGQVPAGEQMVGLLQAMTRLPEIDSPSLRAAVAACFGLDLDRLLDDRGGRPQAEPRAGPTGGPPDGDARRRARGRRRGRPAPAQRPRTRGVRPRFGRGRRAGGFRGRTRRGRGRRRGRRGGARVRLPGAGTRAAADDGRDRQPLARAGGALRAGRAERRTDARHGPRAADRAQLLRRRSARPAIARRLARRAGACPQTVERHLAETGAYPETVGISIWGTSAMRTHGDDVAQVLALLGVRPVWQTGKPPRPRRRGRSRSPSWAGRAST